MTPPATLDASRGGLREAFASLEDTVPRRNLYLVLGIPPDASPEVIRSAYRTLAKASHPDRVGPAGTKRFREIAEAYRVLSDSESRGAHNRELHLSCADERSIVEPLHSEPPPAAEPVESRQGFHASHPSVEDDFVDWTMRSFTHRGVPKSNRQRTADVEIILSPDEAEVGAVLPIYLLTFSRCPACRGTRRDWFSFCRTCNGAGILESRDALQLRIPGMVRDGAVWEVTEPLPEGGVHLCIRIRIDSFGR